MVFFQNEFIQQEIELHTYNFDIHFIRAYYFDDILLQLKNMFFEPYNRLLVFYKF
jgi:hypothetical protein